MKIEESTIEIFNFVVFKCMKGAKITELAALWPLRGLRLTSYSSFNFRHLWLHFTYCSNMRSSYSIYIWSSQVCNKYGNAVRYIEFFIFVSLCNLRRRFLDHEHWSRVTHAMVFLRYVFVLVSFFLRVFLLVFCFCWRPVLLLLLI